MYAFYVPFVPTFNKSVISKLNIHLEPFRGNLEPEPTLEQLGIVDAAELLESKIVL